MKNITLILFIIVSLLNTSCTKNKSVGLEPFTFHLLSEPVDLDPAHFRGSSGSYLFNNLFKGLYSYNQLDLKPENIKECKWVNPLTLSCTLLPKKWSNGKAVHAQEYINNFHRLFSAKTKTYQTEHLLNIKNAKSILKGELPVQKLGIKSNNPGNLTFSLVKPDSNFKYILASSAFGPIYSDNKYDISKSSSLVTNGPYVIHKWIKGNHVTLKPNKFYDNQWKLRPDVKIYFLENDETALTMFETGKMSFLRRLLTSHLDRYKKHPGLIHQPILRFDYIGMTNGLEPHLSLRKALAKSLNFSELQTIYSSKGLPGCPGLPSSFQNEVHCHKFNLTQAKEHLKAVPKNIKNQLWTLHFSKMGGKDIKKGMEWVQNQWSKNLGLNIRLQAVEQGMDLSTLKGPTIDLFRKGVGVNAPSCLSALSTFKQASGENYIKLGNQKLEQLLVKLSSEDLSTEQKKSLCSQGIKILIDSYQWIPLGEIYFIMLTDQSFSGIEINYLNHLDLTNLRRK